MKLHYVRNKSLMLLVRVQVTFSERCWSSRKSEKKVDCENWWMEIGDRYFFPSLCLFNQMRERARLCVLIRGSEHLAMTDQRDIWLCYLFTIPPDDWDSIISLTDPIFLKFYVLGCTKETFCVFFLVLCINFHSLLFCSAIKLRRHEFFTFVQSSPIDWLWGPLNKHKLKIISCIHFLILRIEFFFLSLSK